MSFRFIVSSVDSTKKSFANTENRLHPKGKQGPLQQGWQHELPWKATTNAWSAPDQRPTHCSKPWKSKRTTGFLCTGWHSNRTATFVFLDLVLPCFFRCSACRLGCCRPGACNRSPFKAGFSAARTFVQFITHKDRKANRNHICVALLTLLQISFLLRSNQIQKGKTVQNKAYMNTVTCQSHLSGTVQSLTKLQSQEGLSARKHSHCSSFRTHSVCQTFWGWPVQSMIPSDYIIYNCNL